LCTWGPRQQNSGSVSRRIYTFHSAVVARPLRPLPPGTEVHFGSPASSIRSRGRLPTTSAQFPGRWRVSACFGRRQQGSFVTVQVSACSTPVIPNWASRPRVLSARRLTRIRPPESRARTSPTRRRAARSVSERGSTSALTSFPMAGAEHRGSAPNTYRGSPALGPSRRARAGARAGAAVRPRRPRNSSVPSCRPTTVQGEQAHGWVAS
jgi:hypothetical protein